MITDKDFVDLHVHSSYSLLDGTSSPDLILKATKELGREYMTLTDHGSIDGLIRFQKAAMDIDIKPNFGIELFMFEDWDHRKGCDCKYDEINKKPAHPNLHLTAIAKTEAGLGKIIKACGFANTEGLGKHGRSQRPFLPVDYPLNNDWAGDVIILTGCASSPFWKMKDGGGIELLAKYKEVFGSDLLAENMPIHDWPEQYTINQTAREAAEHFGLDYLITTDIHYVKPEDSEFHEVVLGLSQPGMTWNNPRRWKFDSHSSYVHNVEQLRFAFKKMGWSDADIDIGIKNTRSVAERCFHEIKKQPIMLPKVVDVPDEEENDYFIKLVLDGLKRLDLSDKPGYLERAAREIDLFVDKGFVRYMLMVWDVIKWSKDNGIMIGPSRGSVGGSLVAYALNITNIDPILHRLFFERFMAPGRNDMPDVDIDVEDRNRHLVEQYLKEKYGAYNVAHVSTFSTMLGKTSLRDVGRLFEVPLVEVTDVCRTVLKVHESDERAHDTINDTIASGNPVMVSFAKKYPKVIDYASRLEGQVRGGGIHAAGFVLSPQDLREYPWAHYVPRKDATCVNWDKNDLEHMGLVKLDLLGLSTMSAVSEAVRLIEQRTGVKLDMNTLPLDDKKTYEMISRGETATCFQIGTPGIKKYCTKLRPENFEHLAAITALWRPGPITSGATEMYAKCKNGEEPVTYANDAVRGVTEISYGQMIYQEQVVQMLMVLAGYTYSEADKVRKIVSKKGGVTAWDEEEPDFLAGCKEVGIIGQDEAHVLWQSWKMFALYAFNRAHSVGYGMLAYWTAYLKAHYPAEWLCAYLNFGNADREDPKTGEINRDVALREAQRLGLEILVPDINKSSVVWAVETSPRGKSCLRVGLQDIKFFAEGARIEIEKDKLGCGDYKSINDFIARVKGKSVNKRVFRALLACGTMDSISDPTERERWIKMLDDMWDSTDKPKKHAKVLAEPIPEGDIQEIIAADRKEFLNFDPLTLEGNNAMLKVAAWVGGEFEEDDEDVYVVKGENRWSYDDIMQGKMPGANGLITLSDVTLADIQGDTLKCSKCELRKTCKKPVPILAGAFNAMIVAEAPGENEENIGKPLVGNAGELLWDEMYAFGLKKADVFVTNSVKCRPPVINRKNTKPTPQQIDKCNWLADEIKRVKPKVILSLGNSPLYYFTGKEKGIMEMSGRTEWNHKANAWVVYCIHPSSCFYTDKGDKKPILRYALQEFARLIAQFA